MVGVLWWDTPITVSHDSSAVVSVEDQQTADPAYVDAPAGDYHITGSSAARDACADSTVDHDLDEQVRPMGWAADLGADEYPDAHLDVVKRPSAVVVKPGQALTYTVVVTNDGESDATGVVLTDTLDAWQRASGASSSQGGCAISDPGWGGTVICSPDTLAPGAAHVVTLTAQVSSDVPAAEVMANQVVVTANETEGSGRTSTVSRAGLVYPLDSEPTTLDINRGGEEMVLAQLMEGLFRYGSEGEIEPAGATSYTVSSDGFVYTVTLRSDAVWSDGLPVTAQHYVDGVTRALDPATGAGYAWLLYPIEGAEPFNTGVITDPIEVGVTAVDVHTLRFTLREPAGFFPSIMATFATYPVRLDLISSDPGWAEAGHFVGNGPLHAGDVGSRRLTGAEQEPGLSRCGARLDRDHVTAHHARGRTGGGLRARPAARECHAR